MPEGTGGIEASQDFRRSTGMIEKGHIIEAEFKTDSQLDVKLYQEENEARETSEEELEFITFTLDNEIYAIDIHKVKEVIKMREITEVPRAPKDILGVISLRGTIISVINLRGSLGFTLKQGIESSTPADPIKVLKPGPITPSHIPGGEDDSRGERIVIVKDGASFLGLMVDSVRQVVRVPRSNIEPTPAINSIDSDVIKGIGRHKGRMFIFLDIDKILERMC